MKERMHIVNSRCINASYTKDLERNPTFMYAMPLGKGEGNTRRIFFEEVRTDPLNAALGCSVEHTRTHT
jgi:hypothetical protein